MTFIGSLEISDLLYEFQIVTLSSKPTFFQMIDHMRGEKIIYSLVLEVFRMSSEIPQT